MKHMLQDLGTFELLGIASNRQTILDPMDHLVLLRLQSGERSDGRKVDKLQSDLKRLGLALEARPYIYNGLSEAILNCIDHAYVALQSATKKYPLAGLRWWATSCYDPNTESLRFFVYDQGVGIPATLEVKSDWAPWITAVAEKLGFGNSDADIISAAFEVGKTSTGLGERGKGLNQMREVVQKTGGGYMRILSGEADVRIDAQGQFARSNLASQLGGTLIEWNLPYELFAEGLGDDD